MSSLVASIEGIGFWARGLPTWAAAQALVAGPVLADAAVAAAIAAAPAKPAPTLLAANERRRAPESVAVALDVALAACAAAGRDARELPSVFASTHGDLAITDYMCATLASEPRAISPTRFHNSVHNAAAGYWTIGSQCQQATTAISAYRATFAQGLLEAMAQCAAGSSAVLLVAYDTQATGALARVSPSDGLLGAAMVLSDAPHGTRLRATLVDGVPVAGSGRLAMWSAGNAMAPMLPLFDALAGGQDVVLLEAGPGRLLRVEIAHA